MISRYALIKGNRHIKQSVSLLTQSTITYCYQILQDQHFLRQPADGCQTTSEAGNQSQAVIRGRQSVTSCRYVKSKARIVHTGIPQGLKLSPSLFSFHLDDMPQPTEPVKWKCYADDITVLASGVKIAELDLFDRDFHLLTGQHAIDISTKVIVNLIHSKPGAGQ